MMRMKADIGVISILLHLILWFVLTIVTLGIAMFFFPYSFSKFIINRSSLIDEDGKERELKCHTDLFGNIGHIIIWVIISILTLGLGYIFYCYKVWNYSLNNTTIH